MKSFTEFLDRSVEGMFATESDGRKVFYPFSFGAGRVIPDTGREAIVRRNARRMLIASFAITIPLVTGVITLLQPRGVGFVMFFVAACVLGFLNNLWLRWTVRDLAVSTMRRGWLGASAGQLDRFSPRFLRFGLITSLVFAGAGLAMLLAALAGFDADPAAGLIALGVFAPLAWVYRAALRRRRDQPSASPA